MCAGVLALLLTMSFFPKGSAENLQLKGGLSHLERLVNTQFEMGKPAREHVSGESQKWIQITDWLAGNWNSIDSTKIEREDLWTGQRDASSSVLEIRFGEQFGYQLDSAGKVWTPQVYPELLKISTRDSSPEEDRKAVKRWFFRRSIFPLESGADKVVLRLLDYRFRTDTSNRVVEVESVESFVSYVKLESGLLTRVADSVRFDADGQPVERLKWTSLMQKSKPFVSRDEVESRNIRIGFCKFLEASGRANLIPTAKNAVFTKEGAK